ncbi:uncharacterized protein LOC144335567 [Macaca mulatta]
MNQYCFLLTLPAGKILAAASGPLSTGTRQTDSRGTPAGSGAFSWNEFNKYLLALCQALFKALGKQKSQRGKVHIPLGRERDHRRRRTCVGALGPRLTDEDAEDQGSPLIRSHCCAVDTRLSTSQSPWAASEADTIGISVLTGKETWAAYQPFGLNLVAEPLLSTVRCCAALNRPFQWKALGLSCGCSFLQPGGHASQRSFGASGPVLSSPPRCS